jgi:hypothetical protein
MKSVKKSISERSAIAKNLLNKKVFNADIVLFRNIFPGSRVNNDLRNINKYNEERLQKQVLYALLEKISEDEIHENRAKHSKEYAAELKAKYKAETEAKKAEAAAKKRAEEEAKKVAEEEAEKANSEVETTKTDEVKGEKSEYKAPETEAKTEGETAKTDEVKEDKPAEKAKDTQDDDLKKKSAGASKKSSQK